jgi:putative phosphoserine phosphatase/1-acylglycerol-3-phosphate O-acyltransferase
MSEIVILDFDGVIVKNQSQKIFLKYLFRKRIIGLAFYFKIYFWFILYRLGFVKNPKKIMQYAFGFLEGREVGEIDNIIDNFFEENLKKCIFLEIIDIINEHKQKNRKIFIVSNSVIFIVKKVAQFLGINNYIGTQLEIIDGKYTGKILGEIVYGKNKINFIKDFGLGY